MDILLGFAALLLVIGMVVFVMSPQTGRTLDVFGSGFVGYRASGWPQGVQEEDPAPWSWSTGGTPENPEFHEVDRDGAPTATTVDRGSMSDGMARRRR
ncbi:MAG: hypothetical protein QOI52_641 [Chloroflexota bacterium]|jgi:hypothetical protein|nr:hypothetical protein [Chloroflexota bacterium]